MDPEVERLLRILGFEDPGEKHMKMRIVSSQYSRMSLTKHPDKPGGTKEDFQILKAAYEKLGDIIGNTPQQDLDDKEETDARETFKRYNFAKENIESITIFIETKMVKHWEDVLNDKFGCPIYRTEEVTGNNNGKQWIDNAFKVETEPIASKVYITVWKKEKKGKSTMLIQCESSRQFLNVSYVTDVIPVMYGEAVELMKKSSTSSIMKTRKAKSVSNSPRVSKSTKKPGNLFPCKICDFESNSVGKLNVHMKASHMKKPAPKIKEAILSINKSQSVSSEITIIPSNITKAIHCYICGKGFDITDELSKHEAEEHEEISSDIQIVSSPEVEPSEECASEKGCLNKTDNSCDIKKVSSPEAESLEESTSEKTSSNKTELSSEKIPDSNPEVESSKDSSIEKVCSRKKDVSSETNIVSSLEVEPAEELSSEKEHSPSSASSETTEVLASHEDENFDGFEFEVAKSSYPCDKCNQTYKNQLSFEDHIYAQHTEKIVPVNADANLVQEQTSTITSGKSTHSCDICGKVYDDSQNLKEHIEKEHENLNKSTSNGCEVSTQTLAGFHEQSTVQDENNPQLETLRKEHVELLCLYERQKTICDDQIQQIQKQNDLIHQLNEEKKEREKEINTLKRVSIRNDKTNKEKIKEVEMKLAESFETVDKIAQENLKYAEENRMLEEILNINKIHESNRENDAENDDEIENDEIIAEVITLLEEEDPFDDDVIEAYLKQAETDSNQEERNIETEEENVAEVIELEDNDDPDDDEVIAFYLQQSLNRAKRN